MRLSRYCVLLVFGAFSQSCLGDIALLQNGNVLANVHVDDRQGTQTRPLRVWYFPNSFEYKPESNSVHLLTGNSSVMPVADVISTMTAYDKAMVRGLYRSSNWEYYSPPVKSAVVLPERDPAPVETAGAASATTATAPAIMIANVVPATVPLELRLNQQLDLFLTEQKTLVDTLATSVTMGQINAGQAVEYRLYLLNYQKAVLSRYFPAQPPVAEAIGKWDELTSRVSENRRFPFEI